MLGSLKRELGDLDRVTAWLRVFGMVNSSPGFALQPKVINGFSDLILELYGPVRGAHARRWGWRSFRSTFPSKSKPKSKSTDETARPALKRRSSNGALSPPLPPN